MRTLRSLSRALAGALPIAPALALLVPALGLLAAAPLAGQAADAQRVVRLVPEREALTVQTGETVALRVRALDASGNEVTSPPLRVAAPRGNLQAAPFRDGMSELRGVRAGEYEVVISVVLPPGADGTPPTLRVPVRVTWPAIAEVAVEAAEPGSLYRHTVLRHSLTARHADGSERPFPEARWSSSNAAVASVDRFGTVTAHAAGAVTITAEVEGTRGAIDYRIAEFAAARLEISGGLEEARTGDVLTFSARALTEDGRDVSDAPVTWSLTYTPPDARARPGAPGEIEEGRFVAEEPGFYTILANSGPLTARHTVEIQPRHVVQQVELPGQGRVSEVHTSDFWVFEGVDGRDYAISGTWGADGYAYMWDVTDPANKVKTDSVRVDARTVNDVKVSPDSRYATMTREGASDRRNGLVILDLADPAHPKVASVFDDGLTGGVHNAFPTNDYVYALSAGEKYLILDVSDIYAPRYVSEVRHGDCRIHDVWVLEGVAYSAQWGCGVVVYDVGNGRWGGTPENPVFVTSYEVPRGRTHAVFPYRQESTGKFYIFLGDEIMSRAGMALEGGLSTQPYDPATGEGGRPSNTAGYTQVVDFTDPENPRKVAKYHVPEYGTHNIWVEDDVLYQAYYEGGMRVVDVSGELMGDLARQGREIAVYKSNDPLGLIPNAPMVWSGMPFKGRVYFSDWNSGMWSIRLAPRRPLTM